METAASTAVTLPDDVVREILVRVGASDPAELFRRATTCKRWCALVADPSFLRRCWPEDAPNSSTLAGIFAQQTDCLKPVFVPEPRSPISNSRRSLSSFYEAGGGGFLDNAVPLTSRRGLLLVQRASGKPYQLAVCNILAGTCETLPPLKHNVDFDMIGYTILTTADCSSKGQHRPPPSPGPGYSSFFRVLITGVNSHGVRNRYYVFMFSSDGSSWAAPQECRPNQDNIAFAHFHERGSAVVCQGTAHWIFWGTSTYCTLDVSADTGHVSITKLLVRPYCFNTCKPHLSIAIDGALSLLDLHPRNSEYIHIWARQEIEGGDGTAEWLLTRIIELERPSSGTYLWFSACVGERSGTLLFLDPFMRVAINLETGATEDVCEKFEGLRYEPALPLMVDWPSLFMSRLGGINCELDHQ